MKSVSHFSFLSGAYPSKDNGIYSLKGRTIYYEPQDALKNFFFIGCLMVEREADYSI